MKNKIEWELVFIGSLLCAILLSAVSVNADDLLLPPLTGYNSPSPYLVTRSGTENTNMEAWRAFDGIFNGGGNSPDVQFLTLPASITIDLGAGNATIINTYGIVATTYAGSRNYDMSAWKFYYSDDGATFYAIDERSGEVFSAGEERNFTTNDSIAHRYYRLEILAVRGGGSSMVFAEEKLYRGVCNSVWSCTSYGSCAPDETKECLTVADVNNCPGAAFNGSLSDYAGTCAYPSSKVYVDVSANTVMLVLFIVLLFIGIITIVKFPWLLFVSGVFNVVYGLMLYGDTHVTGIIVLILGMMCMLISVFAMLA